MASPLNILFCTLAGIALWTTLGLGLARRAFPISLSLPLAPVLGWAVHSAVVLPVHMLIGMSRPAVIVQIALSLGAALARLRRTKWVTPCERSLPSVPIWAYAAALLLALGAAIAVFPKWSDDGVALAAPIFDHAKVAMIDEMVRAGVPPANPFFADVSSPPRLIYYYLWHFSAAELAAATGLTGWEADAGLSWFTAFASLTMMMGLAVWISGRASAAALVLLLASTASMRPLLGALMSASLLQDATGFGGWLFQASWAPQHVMAAGCAVLSVMLIAQLPRGLPLATAAVLVLVAAAGFESSVWIGGITFAVAAALASLVLLARMIPGARVHFLVWIMFASVCTAVIASPLLYDQFVAAAARGATPIAVQPFPVLGAAFFDAARRLFDPLAYWLVHLVVEFPAIYPAGMISIVLLVRRETLPEAQRSVILVLASLVGASLLVSAVGVSTVGDNNDLAWRAVLPGAMVLTVYAAVGLSEWIARPAPRRLAMAVVGIALGLPEGVQLIYGNAFPRPTESASLLAHAPALWEAVRRHASVSERVANNPSFLRDLTPWPINISWALMSNRRSCFAGLDFVIPFTTLTHEAREAIDALFSRVFQGEATPEDIEQLASRYGCRLVVITPQDTAWERDPLASSAHYRLVETDALRWRIYQTGRTTGP